MTERLTRIVGLGHYLPPGVVTNDHLAKLMETSDVVRGALVCLASFGSGFTWAASLLRY